MSLLINPYRFAVGGGAAWTPADLGTLSSWYDPSDAANRTITSSAYETLVNKQGTTARNITQATSGNRPALSAGAINGLDAMDFDGSNDWLGHSSPALYAAGACTVAAVFRAATQADKHTIGEADGGAAPIYSILRTQNPNVNGAPDAYIQVDGANVRYAGFGDGTVAFLEGTLDNHVVTITDSGTAITNWVDGNQSYTHAYTRGTMTVNRFTVGCLRFNNTTVTFFDGLIGEIVTCTSALGTSDRQKLEGYLAHKWGAADELDAGHPYKSAAP